MLFAHGSRDAAWSAPFEIIADEIRRLRPDAAVVVSFLEFMRPDLREAVAELTQRGVRRIRVVPLFLGRGAHLKRDLAALVKEVAADRDIELSPALGEAPAVLSAIARWAVELQQA